MKFFSQLALFGGLASLASASDLVDDEFDGAAQLEERAGCPRVQVVGLGGEGTTVGDYGYLQSTIDGIVAKVPHSKDFQIGYPAGADSPTAIASGLEQLQAHIPAFASRCPDSKMIIVGYSAGAAAVADTLCGDVNTGEGDLAKHFRHHIIGVILYGDPTFVRGKKYDRGTCTAADGVVPRVKPGKCFPFGRKARSYCDENDPECCGGDDVAVHFSYPTTYDSEVASFAFAKYTYWRKHSMPKSMKTGN